MSNCIKTADHKEVLCTLKGKKIVLAGNPNVGKSAFFTKFTGTYAEVSNYPGTTVDITFANMEEYAVIDTPGIYGVGNYNEEEIVARDIILNADKVINVVSALSLDRDLFLTQQLLDMGFEVIVALNQYDEAQNRGLIIDINGLSADMGVVIVPTVATKNEGISVLKDCLEQARKGIITPELGQFEELSNGIDPQKLTHLEENPEFREKIYEYRRLRVNSLVAAHVNWERAKVPISEKLGRLLLNPFWGALSAIAVLFVMYKVIGVYVAGDAVDFLENGIFVKYYTPFMTDLVSKVIPSGPINQILVGEFGLLTMTVQYILGVLLPLIVGFNIMMALLEDSGYLPRLAVLTDRFMSKIGLNGRAVIPIILGFGCITMATMTTRILGSSRERTIATTILGLTIPCSAQLGIIVGLIAVAGGLKAWIIYLLTIFIILGLIGTSLNLMLPGKSTHLMIDLPPLRLPLIKNVLSKTISKTRHFLEEASPLFALGALLISVLQMSGALTAFEKFLSPITVNVLHLPKEAAAIFIMGIIRRDFGAAGLAKMAGIGGAAAILTHTQIITSLVVLTLFVPCIASVVVMFKERGVKEASLVWLGSWVGAFIAGGILARILEIF